MKKIFFLLIIINHSLLIDNCFCQWVLQNSGTNVILFNVQFVNRYTGWVTGANSTILKTTDGGQNWFQQQSNLSANRYLTGITMLNADTGYIVGWFEAILKTTNGGTNWIVLREGVVGQSHSYNDVDFINAQTGWICAFLGMVYKTTNGGMNWDSVYVGSGGPLRDILFINNKTGWVAGDVGFIRKTTNGGLNWFFQFFGTTADFMNNSLQFINDNTGWVVGRNDKIFGTTDSGNNWDTLAVIPGWSLFFVNQNTGWTGGDDGDMYKTTDGGYNWYQQTIPFTGGFITDIHFVNDSVGWSTIVNHIIHTTNSGGPVGLVKNETRFPEYYHLYQNYPNPFNANTRIKFDVYRKNNVKLIIYDVVGREINTLLDEHMQRGTYAINWNANDYPSGIYFCRMITEGNNFTIKMTLTK